jgi:hypothetical protein
MIMPVPERLPRVLENHQAPKHAIEFQNNL